MMSPQYGSFRWLVWNNRSQKQGDSYPTHLGLHSIKWLHTEQEVHSSEPFIAEPKVIHVIYIASDRFIRPFQYIVEGVFQAETAVLPESLAHHILPSSWQYLTVCTQYAAFEPVKGNQLCATISPAGGGHPLQQATCPSPHGCY